ncbi:hypothetical protein L249_6010 [Ophiocordyceps polyrhachis-furcata BCC 54312]|uniref:Geranylgeranyl transferase type-2 subunit alpha n=1 Tax=Ophiocordyceps polyrhachis-furcata BCC 54312 TaxID=1330021 RepID=A0A367LID7_9HYPO|nr:hypothetical protein L249_6010 [Ophiocordyceps polyrhachis-furcata BCC 54312]
MSSHGLARTTRGRTEKERNEAVEKIGAYRSLESQIRRRVSIVPKSWHMRRSHKSLSNKRFLKATHQEYNRDTFQLSTQLLEWNPEYYTIWNVRRRCLKINMLPSPFEFKGDHVLRTTSSVDDVAYSQEITEHILQSELDFSQVLFKAHPKCYWIWKYRLWILDQVMEWLPTAAARVIWDKELALNSKLLLKDRRNFHAWAFRRHVVAKLESTVLQGNSMIELEFDFTTRMIRQDLSNFSAWHNRTQLIPRLLQERKLGDEARREFLEDELHFVLGALNVDADDQSLWYYHKYLMYNLIGSSTYQSVAPRLPLKDRKTYISQEIANTEELAEDYAGVKWIWEALVEQTLAMLLLDGLPVGIQDRANLSLWLQNLKTLDPKRTGRWEHWEHSIGI